LAPPSKKICTSRHNLATQNKRSSLEQYVWPEVARETMKSDGMNLFMPEGSRGWFILSNKGYRAQTVQLGMLTPVGEPLGGSGATGKS